ncbi:Na+/H+ antiporter subunit E [Aquabacter sp. CN5-332]|uniref:Na+/H+ antiporter subunit E n=1 Tax=Aquabacter sp. CN5-332 TaxID=3156608 RepID=UPI0032B52AE5
MPDALHSVDNCAEARLEQFDHPVARSADSPSAAGDAGRGPAGSSVILRWLGFFAAWNIVAGHAPADLLAGACTAAFSTALSLRLWPGSRQGFRITTLPRFAIRFLRQSAVAGMETARLAFARHPEVTPGFLSVPTRCAPGMERDGFRAVASLQPGAMPVATMGDTLLMHCLQQDPAIAAQLAEDERAFLAVVGR